MSSAPSETPEQVAGPDSGAAPSGASDSPSTDVDFDSLFNSSFDDESAKPAAKESSPPQAEAAAEPKVPPIADPAAAPKQEPKAEPKPEPAAPQATPQAPTDELPSPSQPSEIAAYMQKHAEALTEVLVQKHFNLSLEEAEALEAEPAKMVPKLLAKSFIASQTAMLNHLTRVIPAMIQAQQAVSKARDESVNQFYSRWKDTGMDQAKHDATVQRLARMYRQMNPDASRAQMIEDVGLMVIAAEKLNGAAKPASAGNGASPKPVAFTPAPAGVGAVPQSAGNDDPFGFLDGLN